MIKLVGIDFDGTLLNSKKELSKGNKEAIKKVIESGITVSIFTGRSYSSAIEYIKELNLDVPCVFQNGALIIKPLSKKVIRQISLKKKDAVEVCEYLNQNNKVFAVFTDFFKNPDMLITDKVMKSKHIQYFENNLWRAQKVDDVLKSLKELEKSEIVQIAFLSDGQFIETLKNKFINLSIIPSAEIDGEYFTEVFGHSIGKEQALLYLEDYYKVSANETMFIGDSFNDLKIIEMVGYGVAMGNAKKEVKDAAKYLTLDNNSDGVKYILEQMILNNAS